MYAVIFSLSHNLITIARVKLLTPYSLAIYDVGRRDKGMYQCLVTNKESSAQAVAELKLGGKLVNQGESQNISTANSCL